MEAALRNLIAYRSSLENRLLARFMDACSQTVCDPLPPCFPPLVYLLFFSVVAAAQVG